MNKSNLMKKAHKIAKTLIGDYSARLSLALKMVWSEIKEGIKVLSERALEIKKELETITEEEAEVLEMVEKKYQEEYAETRKINFSLWEKGNYKRVYISCPWRAKNANGRNYYDLNEKYLFDRYIRM